MQQIAACYAVQIRGLHGEHTAVEGACFDISNRRRLGRLEVDLVQDMYNGVQALVRTDKEYSRNGSNLCAT